MAEFTVLVLKIAFLAVLWLFILLVAAVVNSDMIGRRQRKTSEVDLPPQPDMRKASKRGKREPWILAIDSGIHAGDRLQLVPEVRIGRSDGCELVLDDDYVSSTHAVLSHREEGGWFLKDLGSTNGTFVNAERISHARAVGIKDVIRIGEIQMRLEI
ncbi:MAG: FHA domain-containing protein [Propionibacteriaceae bacterium]|nr:FHA domain-containing protein [Propionibacteriaceae bacterium]